MADATVFLGKADESLASAGDDLASERYNACARNSYFAAFQAGVAALMNEGITPAGQWTHAFVLARFTGMLVARRKLFERRFAKAIEEGRDARVRADYSKSQITERLAKRCLGSARELVAAVKERANGTS